MERKIVTLGYGNLSKENFVALTKANGVTRIADIRSHRRSRVPHFNGGPFRVWLPENGLEYRWYHSLGGWSERDIDEAKDEGIPWDLVEPYTHGRFPSHLTNNNIADSDYAMYTTLPSFWQFGIEQLLQDLDDGRVTAIMCLEKTYQTCHRKLVADTLMWFQSMYDVEPFEVIHIGHHPPVYHAAIYPVAEWSKEVLDKWLKYGGSMAYARGVPSRPLALDVTKAADPQISME